MKRVAFQTTRPGVSRKNAVFPDCFRCPSAFVATRKRAAFCLNPLPERCPPQHAYSIILFAVVSASWRGGDRRAGGAEAPTPPGRSSRVSAGQREGDALWRAAERRAGEGCRLSDVRQGWLPKAGLGVVGGKGPPRPLIPCRPPRRRPRPDTGLKPPSSGAKTKKGRDPFSIRRAEASAQRQNKKRGDRSPQENAVTATEIRIPSRS